MIYTISNDYIVIEVTSIGATLMSLILKNINRDVVLGYDNEEDYLKDQGYYFGGTIGRVCNRINKGTFKLNNNIYTLDQNDKGNYLHGGNSPWNKREFELVEKEESSITFRLRSNDNDQGFPGNLRLYVTYKLDFKNLIIKYLATSDKDCPINITNHSYFNLDNSDNILNHKLKINSSLYTEVDKNLIPTGKILETKNTPLDFSILKLIGKDNIPLDHNFIIDTDQSEIDKYALLLTSKDEKVKLMIETDYPGIQVYSGYYLNNIKGKKNKTYNQYAGIAIEPQFYPDSVNHENFPSTVIKAKKLYSKYISYKFIS